MHNMLSPNIQMCSFAMKVASDAFTPELQIVVDIVLYLINTPSESIKRRSS